MVDEKAVDAGYNPGGVVPEVAQPASWRLFGAILAGLLALLLVPVVAGQALAWAGSLRPGPGRKAARIRLHEPPQPRVRLR